MADNAANGFAHCELGLSEPIGKSTPQRRATYAETPSKRRAGKNSSRPKARRIPAGLPAGAPRRTRAKNLPTKSREWRFRRPSPPDIKTKAGWRVDYPAGRVFFPKSFPPSRRFAPPRRRDGRSGEGGGIQNLLPSPTLSPSPQSPLSFPKTSREFYPANVRFFTAHSSRRQSPGLKIILTPAAPPEREFHLYVHPLVLRIFHRNFPESQTPVKFNGRL